MSLAKSNLHARHQETGLQVVKPIQEMLNKCRAELIALATLTNAHLLNQRLTTCANLLHGKRPTGVQRPASKREPTPTDSDMSYQELNFYIQSAQFSPEHVSTSLSLSKQR